MPQQSMCILNIHFSTDIDASRTHIYVSNKPACNDGPMSRGYHDIKIYHLTTSICENDTGCIPRSNAPTASKKPCQADQVEIQPFIIIHISQSCLQMQCAISCPKLSRHINGTSSLHSLSSVTKACTAKQSLVHSTHLVVR